jgi:hypothetical protein
MIAFASSFIGLGSQMRQLCKHMTILPFNRQPPLETARLPKPYSSVAAGDF